MANNRMYLRCRGCGEELMLGKTLGNGWYTPVGGVELDEFFERHEHCFCGLSEETCGCNPYDSFHFEPFELTYEGRENWGKVKSLQEIEEEKNRNI